MVKFIDAKDIAFTSSAKVGAFRGAVEDLANANYHELKSYWSSTDLKYMHANSPTHFKALYLDQTIKRKEPNSAMILGSLVHCLVLKPEDFPNEFFVLPELNLRTNDGKKAMADLMAENVGKYPVTEEMLLEANAMRASIFNNKEASIMLEAIRKEVSFFWECPYSKLLMRAKIDACSSKCMVELKTTHDASPEGFARHAYNMNYDLSLTHYKQGIARIMDVEPEAFFIVVESAPPYVCQVYKVGESFKETGHVKWISAVDRMTNGLKLNKWPGYTSDILGEVSTIEAPPWAINKQMRGDNGI